MNKLNIALLAGGDSSEREVSLGSAAQVGAALDTTKYNVYPIDVRGASWSYTGRDGVKTEVDKNDFSLPLASGRVRLDYALVMIHGTPGEDGKLQGYLEMAGIPYSTGNVVSMALTFDKLACKRAVAAAGLTTAKERMIFKGEAVDASAIVAELGLPVFVKPNASGSSCGVTKVTEEAAIPSAVDAALRESDAVMIESFVDGREVSCGILITSGEQLLFPVTEIVSKKEFFDYEAKYSPGMSDEITPADLSPVIVADLNRMTVAAYKACGCRGVVRVDFIIAKDGTPYFIEVNSVPGMSAGSIVPKQAACMGMELGVLFDKIIEDTFFERR